MLCYNENWLSADCAGETCKGIWSACWRSQDLMISSARRYYFGKSYFYEHQPRAHLHSDGTFIGDFHFLISPKWWNSSFFWFIDQKLTRIISKSLANPRQELQSRWMFPQKNAQKIRLMATRNPLRSKPVDRLVVGFSHYLRLVLAPSNRWLLERSNPDFWLPSTFAKGETAFCRRRPAAPVMSKRTGLQHAPSHSAVAMGVR